MIINHNLNSMNAHRNMTSNTANAGKAMEKLSSGLRINRAGDDAAGLAISEKMRGQIRGLDQATRNAQDGISLIQTAEGALNETHSILQRMRELAVQSSNDTNTDADRGELQKEVAELTSEITRIAENTEFNTKTLMDGSRTAAASGAPAVSGASGASAPAASGVATAGLKFHIGANAGQNITLEIGNMTATGLAVNAVDISTQSGANTAITTINTAIESVSSERSKLGATQNRLEHTINNLSVGAENLQAAESRVRDVDMAKEMMNFTKNNILNQAAQAMLAQANQQPQAVLQLLR